MHKQIHVFLTANDTDRWVVSVDGYIQSFATKSEAESVYRLIVPEGAHFDDAGYSSCDILPPGYRPHRVECVVSQVQEIDLIGYLKKHNNRRLEHMERSGVVHPEPAWKRMADRREFDSIFGDR